MCLARGGVHVQLEQGGAAAELESLRVHRRLQEIEPITVDPSRLTGVERLRAPAVGHAAGGIDGDVEGGAERDESPGSG